MYAEKNSVRNRCPKLYMYILHNVYMHAEKYVQYKEKLYIQ